jgi:hypothetical protein
MDADFYLRLALILLVFLLCFWFRRGNRTREE